MKRLLALLALATPIIAQSAGVPYGVLYSRNPNGLFVPTLMASNTAMMYNLVTNALPGTTVYLSSGTFDITNIPLAMPAGVTLSGISSNATIIRNWINGAGAIAGRGCGIAPGDNCTIQNLQITNALAQTAFQGCIGAISPQPIFTGLTTRSIFGRGSSDIFQVSQDNAFSIVWTDYGSCLTSKWDVAVFVCNDATADATVVFNAFGTALKSVGPAATGANTAHGFYANANPVSINFQNVTFDVSGNSVNRAWQLDAGSDSGDVAGVFAMRDCFFVNGNTVNGGSIIPTTNTALLSLNASPRDGGNLTNITVSAAPPTLTYTNFISGRAYTNVTGRPQYATVQASYVAAQVNGAAEMGIYVDSTGGTTWSKTNMVTIGTTITTIADTYIYQVTGFIPTGASYIVTNTSRGSGNSTAVISTACNSSLITY